MKKILLSIFVAASFFGTTSAADFGVTAGVGVVNLKADNSSELKVPGVVAAEMEFTRACAWNAGLKLNQNFGQHAFAEASLLFQQLGYVSNLKLYTHLSGAKKFDKYKSRLYYVSLPINFGYKFNAGSNLSFAPKAGVTLNYGVAGKEALYDNCNPFSELEDQSFGLDNFNRFDCGVNAGANINVMNYQLGLQYTWGLTDFSDQIDDSKNRIFQASLTYFF